MLMIDAVKRHHIGLLMHLMLLVRSVCILVALHLLRVAVSYLLMGPLEAIMPKLLSLLLLHLLSMLLLVKILLLKLCLLLLL